MTDLHVEFANEEEVSAIASLRMQALVTDPASYLNTIADEIDRTEEEWVNYLSKPNRTVALGYTAIQPSEVVGLLLVDTGGNSANLHGLYIRPAYRRNGFATELIRRTIDLTHERGVSRVTAQTLYGNTPAQNLFEQCGFRITSGKAVNRARYAKQFGEYEHEKLLP